MIKRLSFIVITLLLSLMSFVSCFHEFGKFPEQTNPDISLLLPPKYTENYSYLPTIEYEGKQYRADELCQNYEKSISTGDTAITDVTSLEKFFRESSDSLIVVGTVIDSAAQAKVYSYNSDESYSSEVICPFKIEEIIYSSDGIKADIGETIELRAKGLYYLYTDENGEYKCHINLYCTPFISGAKYLLYLSYSKLQPDYGYRRYDVYSYGKFEISSYASRFDFKTNNAKDVYLWQGVLRKYDLYKDGMYVHDAEKYPYTQSLDSKDAVNEIGIKIGNTIVEGYEQLESSYKCIGYSEKTAQYSYESFEYESYDISSGIIPDGCPIISCDYDDQIELIVNIENSADPYGYVLETSLYDISGNYIGYYYIDDIMQFASSYDEIGYGLYWFKIDYIVPGPELPGYGTPEVGAEYEGQKSSIFVIVMD